MRKFLKICWIVYVCLFVLIALLGNNIFLAVACALWEWPILLLLILLSVLEGLSGREKGKTDVRKKKNRENLQRIRQSFLCERLYPICH